jgi:hypothetical protein
MTPILNTLVSWSAVLVCAVFALIVVTTYWPGKRKYYESQGSIPLHDGEPLAKEH